MRKSTDFGPVVVLVAVVTALAIGVGTGQVVPTAAAALSGAVAAASVRVVSSPSLRRRAAGSCGLVGALAVGLWSVLVGASSGGSVTVTVVLGSALAALAFLAVGATAVALEPGSGYAPAVVRTAGDSAVTATFVAVVGYLAWYGGSGATAFVARELFAVATATPFAAFVSLQLLAILAVFLFGLAVRFLEPYTPDHVDLPTFETILERVKDLPEAVVYAYGFQVVLWFAPGMSESFAAALAVLGPVGGAIALALTSGVGHALVALAAFVLALVCAGRLVDPAARPWLEPVPLRTLAFGAGGAAVALAIAVGGRVHPSVEPTLVLPALLGVLGASFVGLAVATRAEWLGKGASLESGWRRWSLGLGGAALFAATIVGALAGLAPLLVFAGVAAAIVVWDVGENALALRRQLGASVDSREVEAIHATGSVAIGAAGVAVAAAALYGVGTVSPPGERWQAVAPVALTLVAVVAFALTLTRGLDWRRLLALEWLSRRLRSTAEQPAVLVAIAVSAGAAVLYGPAVLVLVAPLAFVGLLVWYELTTNRGMPRLPPGSQ